MRSIFRVLLSAALGIGIAVAVDHFFPRHPREKVVVVDTSKPDKIPQVSENPPLKTERSEPVPDRDQVRVRGYVVRNGKVNVVLSDGRTVTERDGLTRVSRNSVEIHGETLFLAEAKDRPAAAAPLAAAPAANAAAESPALPSPPAEPESPWITHSDGVSRLREPETMATAFAR